VGELQRDRMICTPEMKTQITEICKGTTNMADSINRIYIWVQREIHYISIKSSVSSSETGHPAEFTFKQKYGDCTDKSVLFATMLREIGVEAYPIIVMSNDDRNVPRDLPDLSGNHAITLVKMNGENIFLDATSTTNTYPNYRSDDVGVTYVCALCREHGITGIPPPEMNAMHIEISGNIADDGNLSAKYISSFVGDREASWRGWWEYEQADRRGKTFQDWLNSIIPGAVISDWSLDGVDNLAIPFHEKADFNVSDYTSEAADLHFIKTPFLKHDYNFDEVALSERKFPIEYTAPKQLSHSIEFAIPKDWEVVFLPESLKINNPRADYTGGYIQKDGKVIFRDVYRLKSRVVPASEYSGYREFCRKIATFAEKQAILRKR
jgi:hypothetical protein